MSVIFRTATSIKAATATERFSELWDGRASAMFELSDRPIETTRLHDELSQPRAGALVVFEGWVRDLHQGRKVCSLEYEAYSVLAETEGRKILAEAMQRFTIMRAACVHRTGTLGIGELAVWVGVTAEHREDAFQACRYIIDEVKARVPIWKKEHYADRSSGWVNVSTEAVKNP